MVRQILKKCKIYKWIADNITLSSLSSTSSSELDDVKWQNTTCFKLLETIGVS